MPNNVLPSSSEAERTRPPRTVSRAVSASGATQRRTRVRRPSGATPLSTEALFGQYVLPEIEVLLRVATSLTRNHADAEDLVQDTLIRAYRAIDRFDGRHPRAWLLTILRNTHVNRNRRRRPELFRDPQLAADRLLASPSQDRTDALIDDELDDYIVRALDKLDQRFRAVVELVDIQGLSQAEAAGVLNVPVGTVMSRLHRARARIRGEIDRLGQLPPRGAT